MIRKSELVAKTHLLRVRSVQPFLDLYKNIKYKNIKDFKTEKLARALLKTEQCNLVSCLYPEEATQ